MTTTTARAIVQGIGAPWQPLKDVHDQLVQAIEAAIQAAREEERAPMECGHPRACRVIANERDTVFTCLACAREERAVEEARAQMRDAEAIRRAADAIEGKRGSDDTKA